ncbi:MAG: DUF4037 domain-containing protein [Planctomycetes bacterium]|nr:DUF4037 domain-containing protein [Planctomycetota bacterium]
MTQSGTDKSGDSFKGTGIAPSAFWRFVQERVFTLEGVSDPWRDLTILLTGSRSVGLQHETSDVDVDILCPARLYKVLHAKALAARVIQSTGSFLCIQRDAAAKAYFGAPLGNPHFSVTPLETVQAHFAAFEDVPMWIWTHARVAHDPRGQFTAIRDRFSGYPRAERVRKIKFHWLAAAYFAINMRPREPDGILPAVAGLSNAILELLRVFFLVEDRPYPYPAKLMPCAKDTTLGREFCPLLSRAADEIAGDGGDRASAPERLQEVFERLFCANLSEDAARLQEACEAAMVAAGVPGPWVQADYENVDQLLNGELGPFMQ